MPHNERPKNKSKRTYCAHCQTEVRQDKKAFRLADGQFVHFGCYFLYRRLNGGRTAS